MKSVKYIAAKRNVYNNHLLNGERKRRVCAYARVSTDMDDQKNSFEAQQDYYKKKISKNKAWDYCGLYSDDGISGLSTNNRNGFNSMIKDAMDLKVDLIITKSVSRFARNTIDSLRIIRKLKNIGVEIYFEKENIWTFSQNGEILLTLMSSFAQEESRSISQNVLWSKKRMMEKGKCSIPYSSLLGYEKGENGLVVNLEQAKIVKLIFELFLDGLNSVQIKHELESKSILSPCGLTTWNSNVVLNILRNEKYKGDLLLQKYYTKDFITKKVVKNNGVKQKYYIESDHEAIIDRDTFDYVQHLLSNVSGRKVSNNMFANKVYCGTCGNVCVRKKRYERKDGPEILYYCKHKNNDICKENIVSENKLLDKTLSAINYLIINKDEIVLKAKTKINNLKQLDGDENRFERVRLEIFIRTLENCDREISELNHKYLNTLVDKIFISGEKLLFKFINGEEVIL